MQQQNKSYRMYILQNPAADFWEQQISGDAPQRAPRDLINLKNLFEMDGWHVKLIDADMLSDPRRFGTEVCDLLVLPDGAAFPLRAEQNFKRFFKDGGRVITIGGYAFSQLIDSAGKVEEGVGLLGSNQPVECFSCLRYDPSTIPLFDEEYTYDGVVAVRPDENQTVFAGELDCSDAPLRGYSSVTVMGGNRGRWYPLLNGYNAIGEKCATIAAMMRLYNEQDPVDSGLETWKDYASNSIAFFGVVNKDLFAPGNPELRQGLCRLARLMMRDVYIGHIDNRYNCYRQGESPSFDIYIENSSSSTVSGLVNLEIKDTAGGRMYSEKIPCSVPEKTSRRLTARWDTKTFEDDFYIVKAYVTDQSGDALDIYETGFSVWDDAVVADGPAYSFENNYINIVKNGVKTPIFAVGVDDAPEIILLEWAQTPLAWRRDFIDRYDAGTQIYENLQIYTWYPAFRAMLETPESKEKFFRKVDNVVYMAQKYRQIYMMGLAIGDNCAITIDNLEFKRRFICEVVERYRKVPGIIYYLNGDLVVTLTPDLQPDYTRFLREKYRTDEALCNAYGRQELTIDGMQLDCDYMLRAASWSDVHSDDIQRFRLHLVSRWIHVLAKTVRDRAGNEKAVLCEFYSWPSEMVDVTTLTDDLTYSNIGYFDPGPQYTRFLATTDQRFRGKSMGVGEFGRITHPQARRAFWYHHIGVSRQTNRNNFFHIINTTLAMGGSHAQLWIHNEGTRLVPTMSVNYLADRVHRELYFWYRNACLFTRGLVPVYSAPQTAVLMADSTRLSASEYPFHGHFATQGAFDILHKTGIGELMAVNDSHLLIDDAVRVIFYPLAYDVPDAVYEQLLQWVKRGGVLYISGDFAYDQSKQRTKGERLAELAGVETVKCVYAGIDFEHGRGATYSDGKHLRAGIPNVVVRPAGAQPWYTDGDGNPVISRYQLGSGQVVYSTDPLELFFDPDAFNDTSSLHRQGLYEIMRKQRETPDDAFQSIDAIAMLDIDQQNKRLQDRDRKTFRFISDRSAAILNQADQPASNDVLYRQVLSLAGVRPLPVTATSLDGKLFRLPLKDGGCVYAAANAGSRQSVGFTLEHSGVTYNWSVDSECADLLRFNNQGELAGIQCAGSLTADGRPLLKNECIAQVFSLDGLAIKQCRRLVVTPQTEGIIRLYSGARWLSPQICGGQMQSGRFIIAFRQPAGRTDDGGIEIKVNPVMTRTIILVCEASDEQACAKQVEQLLLRR